MRHTTFWQRGTAVLLVLGASAAGGLLNGSVADAQVVIGKSIGGIRLGETKAQVRKARGAPTKSRAFRGYHGQYGRGTDWSYKRLLVTFSSKGRVRGIDTTLKTEKTTKGIGVGSTIDEVKAAYPAVRCRLESEVEDLEACSFGNTIFTAEDDAVISVDVGFVVYA